jgi:hypothetical protein
MRGAAVSAYEVRENGSFFRTRCAENLAPDCWSDSRPGDLEVYLAEDLPSSDSRYPGWVCRPCVAIVAPELLLEMDLQELSALEDVGELANAWELDPARSLREGTPMHEDAFVKAFPGSMPFLPDCGFYFRRWRERTGLGHESRWPDDARPCSECGRTLEWAMCDGLCVKCWDAKNGLLVFDWGTRRWGTTNVTYDSESPYSRAAWS